MTSNLDPIKTQLVELIKRGDALMYSMHRDCQPEEFEEKVKTDLKSEAEEFLKTLPNFKQTYQRWYTEACAVIRQLIPERLPDFIRHYEKPKNRKEISFESYRIEDNLQGLEIWQNQRAIVSTDAAIPQLRQQVAILKAAKSRFESRLHNLRQVLQADLFDSEILAAEHLAKFKFYRAAGALGGVVLERHLAQVCEERKISPKKKNPTIADFNDALKDSDAIEPQQWRKIQYLADLRNLCGHARKTEPTQEQITELLTGVAKTIKTVL